VSHGLWSLHTYPRISATPYPPSHFVALIQPRDNGSRQVNRGTLSLLPQSAVESIHRIVSYSSLRLGRSMSNILDGRISVAFILSRSRWCNSYRAYYAGSNPAESEGLLRMIKICITSFLRRGSKAVGTMS
jgi:hypothetical protein